MPRYRIFTNDRRAVKGVPMYSCLKEITASSEDAAVRTVPQRWGPPNYAAVKAIKWPASGDDVNWLKKHVGA